MRNLCTFKEAAIKAACCALVVKGHGECLCVGSFLRMLRAFSMAFTFAGEQVLWECFSEILITYAFVYHLMMSSYFVFPV